jgi:hypothetical protein
MLVKQACLQVLCVVAHRPLTALTAGTHRYGRSPWYGINDPGRLGVER